MQADGKDSEVMPRVNLKKLKPLELLYLKQAEDINLQRAIKFQNTRKQNRILGCSLLVGVLGIYFYTINSVKQEAFLDDFDEPETEIKSSIPNNKTV